MNDDDDVCQPCSEHTKKVYVDGSATTIGASSYAGWGMWSPDNPNYFKQMDLSKGETRDRIEL
eukprot:4338995-Heterocapsa_arctica.AAC.1